MHGSLSGSDTSSNTQHHDNEPNTTDSKLILYNDDVNEYSYVVECMIDVLSYNDQQAEQLTMLAHFRGSATIKEGPSSLLTQLSGLLSQKGLKTAVLQK